MKLKKGQEHVQEPSQRHAVAVRKRVWSCCGLAVTSTKIPDGHASSATRQDALCLDDVAPGAVEKSGSGATLLSMCHECSSILRLLGLVRLTRQNWPEAEVFSAPR